jgi:arylsulfatase A-like enzyme
MKRRDFLKALGPTILSVSGLTWGTKVPAKRPNLLFVFADQFRRQALGFMNQDPVITPNLDQFAQDSRVFINAISACPLCTPFRSMLMTGRYPLSTGMTTNCLGGMDIELADDEICIGDVLKANGHQTGYIGKWHLDSPSRHKMRNPPDGATGNDAHTPPGPRRHGFDFWYAYNTNSRHTKPNYWKDNPKKINVNQWSVEHETDVAIEFIKNRDKDKPFALFVSWNPPHAPFIAPEKYNLMYPDKELPLRPNFKMAKEGERRRGDSRFGYYAAVSSCDDNFGRLLKTLDEEGIADDTVAVFTSDHGEMLDSHGRWGKVIWYEESIGIPFLIRWPGHVPPARENMLFASYDFMPTLLGLMKSPIPNTVEGTDYSDAMLGKQVSKPSSAFIARYGQPNRILAVQGRRPSDRFAGEALVLIEKGIDWRTVGYRGLRTERYTYIVDRALEGTEGLSSYQWQHGWEKERTFNSDTEGIRVKRFLYDNENDPFQLNPVCTTHANENPVMAELDKELQQWLDKMNDPFPLT